MLNAVIRFSLRYRMLIVVLSLTMMTVAWLVGREYARRERAVAVPAVGVAGGPVLAH